MAGNVTGFQRPYTFKANGTYSTVGTDQAVVYGANAREAEVPESDNLKPLGVVTYQEESRDGATVAVQLDRLAEVSAEGAVNFGDEVIVGAGGVVKTLATAALSAGVDANILGVAQNTVADGDKAQILIRPTVKTV